jgi:hypothetical protein
VPKSEVMDGFAAPGGNEGLPPAGSGSGPDVGDTDSGTTNQGIGGAATGESPYGNWGRPGGAQGVS